MQNKGALFFCSIIVLIFAYALYLATGFAKSAGLLPILFSSCGLVVATLHLILEIKAVRSTPSEDNAKRPLGNSNIANILKKLLKHEGVSYFIWIIIFFLLICFLGFFLAIPVFLFLILLLRYQEKLIIVILMPLGFTLAYYLLFIRIVNIASYEGYFFKLLDIAFYY